MLPGWIDWCTGPALHRRAVKERKKVFVHAPAKVCVIVAAALNQGADHEGQDKSGLGELAGFKPIVVSAGLGIGIAVDPVAVVPAQFGKIVIPMRAEPQGIADESAHDGAGGAIADEQALIIYLLLILIGDIRIVSESGQD